jgi:hypothetical protein
VALFGLCIILLLSAEEMNAGTGWCAERLEVRRIGKSISTTAVTGFKQLSREFKYRK